MRSVGGATGVRIDLRRVGEFTVAVLQGEISERFDGAELGRRLTGDVVLDLSQVERITSFGVREWLKMLREARTERLYLVHCSEPVVNQVRMIRSFCGAGRIVSFFAPYLCESCGTEFSALYDAVDDFEAISESRALPVQCPQCLRLGTFDDEPEIYLSVQSQLVDLLPEDLVGVMAQLRAFDGAPIRKAVAGDETWVTFSTRLDGTLRLHRVLEGLEGLVVFDLSAVPSSTTEGLDRLLAGFASLGEEVLQLSLVGCPLDLLRMILDRPDQDPRVGIISVKVQAVCSNPPSRRAALVTLRAPVVEMALRRGASPPVHCDWCSGSLDFGDALDDLRRALDISPERRVTPAPAPRGAAQTPGPRVTPAPSSRFPMPAAADTNWSQTPAGAAYSQNNTPAPVASVDPGQVYAPSRGIPPLLVVAGAVLMGTLVGGAGLIGGLTIVLSERSVEPAAPVPNAAAAASADDLVLGWTDGLPPAWTEHRFAQGADRVEIVGGSNAATAEEGLELARRDMMRTLLDKLRLDVQEGSGLPPISASTLTEPQLEVAVARFERDVGAIANPERIDGAVRQDSDAVYVVARYALSQGAWDHVRSWYGQSHYFRGITVSAPLPTHLASVGQSADLVVSQTASWMRAAEVGDVVIGVNGRSVSKLAEFESALDSAWRRTPPGEWMPIRVVRDGTERNVEFRKPGLDFIPQ